MEAVGVALVVFGPLVVVFVLLVKAVRKLRPRPVTTRRWQNPPRGGEPSGVREPRRPLTPAGSGAVSLALPSGDQGAGVAGSPGRAEPGPRHGVPGHRLAG